MCGIAGLINHKYLSKDKLSFIGKAMADKLIHRGPDSSGIWTDENCGIILAHRRLAIQDLSPNGAQPMHSHSNRLVICFNGEIYNFHEIAEKLSHEGIRFQGHSDTEILLSAIEHWGIDKALSISEGMFAFALWNKSTQQLILARDRIGEKPLYYGLIDDGVCFASELKAFHCLPGFTGEINRESLTLFMKYGYVPTPYSIFADIYKLTPGTYINLSRQLFDDLSTRHKDTKSIFDSASTTFWSLNRAFDAGKNAIITDPVEAEAELENLLHKTIRHQMISDVPLGAFLSGGIDSSIVTAIMQRESKTPINTFTIGYHEPAYNEAEFAKNIARHLGTNHIELYIQAEDGLDVIPKIPNIYDEPFADVSQIPMYLVTKLARQHVTVALSGDGGDELFAGYNRYHATQRTWKIIERLPRHFRTAVSRLLLGISPESYENIYARLVQLGILNNQANFGGKIHKFANIMASDTIYDAYQYLLSFWHEANQIVLHSAPPLPETHKYSDAIIKNPTFCEYAMLIDQRHYLPDDNLVKGDRASMANALEMRLPLLSHKIIEYSWRLPIDMKLSGGTTKKILRNILYKYIPKELIERPKMGFSVPLDSWLKGPLREWAEDLLNPARLTNEGFLSSEKVNQAWQEHITNKRNNQLKLWSALMFQAWLSNIKSVTTK